MVARQGVEPCRASPTLFRRSYPEPYWRDVRCGRAGYLSGAARPYVPTRPNEWWTSVVWIVGRLLPGGACDPRIQRGQGVELARGRSCGMRAAVGVRLDLAAGEPIPDDPAEAVEYQLDAALTRVAPKRRDDPGAFHDARSDLCVLQWSCPFQKSRTHDGRCHFDTPVRPAHISTPAAAAKRHGASGCCRRSGAGSVFLPSCALTETRCSQRIPVRGLESPLPCAAYRTLVTCSAR